MDRQHISKMEIQQRYSGGGWWYGEHDCIQFPPKCRAAPLLRLDRFLINPNRSILYLGFDGWRSPTSRSKATATHDKVSDSIFLLEQKITAKRKNPDGQIYLSKSGFAFCRDYSRFLKKRQKKWHLQWDSNPCCRDENPVS